MHCYCNVLINQPKLCTCDMPLNTCTIIIMSLSGAKKIILINIKWTKVTVKNVYINTSRKNNIVMYLIMEKWIDNRI